MQTNQKQEENQKNYKTLEKILEEIKQNKNIYLIGVVGIPGSGKSYFSKEILSKNLENSMVLGMDGKDLDENGVRYRGAHYTFDKNKFKNDLISLKQNKSGKFPSFDHALKDPIENDIEIQKEIKYIIVEGLYLYLNDWNIFDLFDYKIFIECPEKIAYERLSQRHVQTGVTSNIEEAWFRIKDSDDKNAQYLQQNSNLDNKQVAFYKNYQ